MVKIVMFNTEILCGSGSIFHYKRMVYTKKRKNGGLMKEITISVVFFKAATKQKMHLLHLSHCKVFKGIA